MSQKTSAGPPLAFEGRSFGGYRIARPIATGGMATIFLARKTGPGRYAQTAALKIIHPHLARDRALLEMFMDEARLASCVNHPAVCRVLDFGEAEGTFFLAMEYVRGESWGTVLEALRSRPERQSRLLPFAAHVIGQACEGLHAIHEAVDADGRPLNIVHRDVSPQNLLVAYDGSVRLLDFGIASAEGRPHTGSTEIVRGRYAYMAPEQMCGGDVDRRADIWSLGVILREALTGHHPFLRETQIATMRAVTQDPLPTWPDHVPQALAAAVDRALAREPEQRYATAREFGDALIHLLGRDTEALASAELAQAMRSLFADRIALKRAALRELSGDDAANETDPSGYPALSMTPPRSTEGAPAFDAPKPRRSSLVGAAFVLFGAAALSWWLSQPSAGSSAISAGPTTREAAPPGPAYAPPHAGGAAPLAASHARSESTGAPASPAPRVGGSAGLSVSGRPPEHTQTGAAGAPERPVREEMQDESQRASEDDPPRAPARAPGVLVVGASEGWAVVYEGARELGTTPLRLELPSGPHQLSVRAYGEGSPRKLRVRVKPGETTKLRIEL